MSESLSCTALNEICDEKIASAGREMESVETRDASPSLAPGLRSGTGVPYEERRRGPRALAAHMLRAAEIEHGRHAAALAMPPSDGGNLIEMAPRGAARESSKTAGAPRSGIPGPLILVVDANAALCHEMKQHLTACGYEVLIVHSIGEARAALSAFMPALVIAEMEGGEQPGHQLCAQMKATPRLREIPVILMTYSGGPRDYARAYSMGAIVCMAKPFDVERLGHVVQLLAPLPRGN